MKSSYLALLKGSLLALVPLLSVVALPQRAHTDMPKDAVSAHNLARAAVKAPPLKWNPKLAVYAKEWGEHLAKNNNCKMQHRPASGKHAQKYGENLYWGSARMWSDGKREVVPTTAADVVKAWDGEKAHYNAKTHTCQAGQVCGHYTQVVWKKSREVGCAQIICADKSQLWVCNYDPPGNVQGRHPF